METLVGFETKEWSCA